ncbi:hypothetical protein EIN_183910 [Entamoeba invadens IP1]|uniref:hypothetical protein n=1 Tax=Entamoeba invadens IP1 TaxID=370355 RepID=UPI0002C3D6D5|nr:hypothetical protein EIN_183910 [Entamoeba invadens IP1]ELP94074.1 hypothetical protein EIN_183910 [Entamoeba invadens IP1]|eukprot:XP_004260845.1 hypothetical protein EIN_183910 [Entamoeba invadens IP1]
MSKRPTVVKPATEGSKRIVTKQWNENNSNPQKYEIDSIEQVMPCAPMLMSFENTRSEMERTIGAKFLQSKNVWICPPAEYFDKIINEGCACLPEFNAFFTNDVSLAIKDGYHPYRVILCRVLLGRDGRDYEFKYGKFKLKRICAIPSFIVTFVAEIDTQAPAARASETAKDEAYENLINNGHLGETKENRVVDDDGNLTNTSQPSSQTSSATATPQKVIKVEGQKFCDNCGELCTGSAKFCPSCGFKF